MAPVRTVEERTAVMRALPRLGAGFVHRLIVMVFLNHGANPRAQAVGRAREGRPTRSAAAADGTHRRAQAERQLIRSRRRAHVIRTPSGDDQLPDALAKKCLRGFVETGIP